MISGLVTLATCSLLACAPAPAPTSSPTPAFASEEEAFAAAEEVYRAYNDALNDARSGASSKDPSQYLVGQALESDLDAERYFREQGATLTGKTTFTQFEGTSTNSSGEEVEVQAQLCLDVSETHVLDADGADVTPKDRQTRLPLDLTFVGTIDALLISSSNLVEDDEC